MSDHPDLSDVGDLSWDEGDLPHQEIKVASLGFMYRPHVLGQVEMFSYNPQFETRHARLPDSTL